MTTPSSARTRGAFGGTARIAAAFLLVTLCWVFTNPGAAAPDEPDHLVKALGNASGQLGERPDPDGEELSLLQERNASTTRLFSIPARLAPDGMTCFAFVPTATADCQPKAAEAAGERIYPSALGDYPAFLYLPIGAVAQLAHTPYQAFVAGRLVVALLTFGLVWLGMAQLTRWLGRRAVIGYAVLLTPVALFTMGSVSTSGIELTAAAAVGSVVTTCVCRPEAVHRPSTHLTFLVAAAALALSRQLGVLTLAVYVVVLLSAVGLRRSMTLLRDRQPSFVATVALVGVAAGAALWWERSYDHPAHVLSPFDGDALAAYLKGASPTLSSAVGTFGWLDTSLPSPATGAFIALWLGVLTAACLVGSRRETWTILLVVAFTLMMSLIVYASAFYPIGAAIQGRHFLPLFSLAVILSSAVLTRPLTGAPRLFSRVLLATGMVVFLVQFSALYTNGRRYAVGTHGPWWWPPHARWEPAGGWTVWLLLSLAATAWLAIELLALRREDPPLAGQRGEVERGPLTGVAQL